MLHKYETYNNYYCNDNYKNSNTNDNYRGSYRNNYRENRHNRWLLTCFNCLITNCTLSPCPIEEYLGIIKLNLATRKLGYKLPTNPLAHTVQIAHDLRLSLCQIYDAVVDENLAIESNSPLALQGIGNEEQTEIKGGDNSNISSITFCSRHPNHRPTVRQKWTQAVPGRVQHNYRIQKTTKATRMPSSFSVLTSGTRTFVDRMTRH